MNLIEKLQQRADEAGFPKSELYREARNHIIILENTICRVRTLLLQANHEPNLKKKQDLIDHAIQVSRHPNFILTPKE